MAAAHEKEGLNLQVGDTLAAPTGSDRAGSSDITDEEPRRPSSRDPMVSSSWLFTDHILTDGTASRRAGISLAQENAWRRESAADLQALGTHLRLPQLTIAMGIVYMHRLAIGRSVTSEGMRDAAFACLLLAGKMSNFPIRVSALVVAIETIVLKTPENEKVRAALRQGLLIQERAVLRQFGFDLFVELPYATLLAVGKALPEIEPELEARQIVQHAWNFINDSLRTTACLRYSADVIAAAGVRLSIFFHAAARTAEGLQLATSQWDNVFGYCFFYVAQEDVLVAADAILNVYPAADAPSPPVARKAIENATAGAASAAAVGADALSPRASGTPSLPFQVVASLGNHLTLPTSRASPSGFEQMSATNSPHNSSPAVSPRGTPNPQPLQPPSREKSPRALAADTASQSPRALVNAVPPRCRSVELYRKLERISEGTYGVVYKAQDRESGDIVALKKITYAEERDFPITSMREVEALLRVPHKNIVRLREIVTLHNSFFMVMDYAETDLATLLFGQAKRREPRPPLEKEEIKCLIWQLLKGLAFMHEKGFMHRDLKPSNLLFGNDGVLRIADFGLARTIDPNPHAKYTNKVVTLWYRPPELLLGATQYSPTIDTWSVGCLLSEVTLIRPLFPGKTELEELELIFQILGPPQDSWVGYWDLPFANTAQKPNVVYTNCLQRRHQDTVLGGDYGYHLLTRLLAYDPSMRITAAEALDHPFFKFDGPFPETVPHLRPISREPAQPAYVPRLATTIDQPAPSQTAGSPPNQPGSQAAFLASLTGAPVAAKPASQPITSITSVVPMASSTAPHPSHAAQAVQTVKPVIGGGQGREKEGKAPPADQTGQPKGESGAALQEKKRIERLAKNRLSVKAARAQKKAAVQAQAQAQARGKSDMSQNPMRKGRRVTADEDDDNDEGESSDDDESRDGEGDGGESDHDHGVLVPLGSDSSNPEDNSDSDADSSEPDGGAVRIPRGATVVSPPPDDEDGEAAPAPARTEQKLRTPPTAQGPPMGQGARKDVPPAAKRSPPVSKLGPAPRFVKEGDPMPPKAMPPKVDNVNVKGKVSPSPNQPWPAKVRVAVSPQKVQWKVPVAGGASSSLTNEAVLGSVLSGRSLAVTEGAALLGLPPFELPPLALVRGTMRGESFVLLVRRLALGLHNFATSNAAAYNSAMFRRRSLAAWASSPQLAQFVDELCAPLYASPTWKACTDVDTRRAGLLAGFAAWAYMGDADDLLDTMLALGLRTDDLEFPIQ